MECDENKIDIISDELREKVCDDGGGKRIITPPVALDVIDVIDVVTAVGPPIPSDLGARVEVRETIQDMCGIVCAGHVDAANIIDIILQDVRDCVAERHLLDDANLLSPTEVQLKIPCYQSNACYFNRRNTSLVIGRDEGKILLRSTSSFQ